MGENRKPIWPAGKDKVSLPPIERATPFGGEAPLPAKLRAAKRGRHGENHYSPLCFDPRREGNNKRETTRGEQRIRENIIRGRGSDWGGEERRYWPRYDIPWPPRIPSPPPASHSPAHSLIAFPYSK